MSYSLQAFIGELADLAEHAPSGGVIVPLGQGKGMIPLEDRFRELHEIPFLPFTDEGKAEIPESIEVLASQFNGPVAYVEAEFFGGDGTQASAIWKDRNLIFGPLVKVSAINEALQRLGVAKGSRHDEFDALELGNYRDTNDWASKSSTGS
jgi:hypothetical protein